MMIKPIFLPVFLLLTLGACAGSQTNTTGLASDNDPYEGFKSENNNDKMIQSLVLLIAMGDE